MTPSVKAAAELVINSFFHREISMADTSNFSDNSAKVAFSFRASIATFALNSGVNFLLVAFFIMVAKLVFFLTYLPVSKYGSIIKFLSYPVNQVSICILFY